MAQAKEQEVTQESTEETVTTAETPEVKVEDLQSKIQGLEATNLQLQQSVSKHAESERKLKDQSESISSLHKRLEAQEESNATMLDYLEDIRGQSVEETPTRPTSHRDKLTSQRAERDKTKTETAVDPEVTKFVNYVEAQGLDINNILVVDAMKQGTPQEALTHLKGKVKEAEDARIANLVEEKAQSLKEQKLKESGLTSAGAEGPNAPGGKEFSRASIAKMSPEEYKANKPAIDEALRQGKIK